MSKNVFFENLKLLIDQKIFVSIFTDIYRESFIGYIIRISEDLLLLYSYEIGKPNGIKIFRLDDITRIRWGTRELDEIESLISLPPNLEAINKITMDNKAVAIKQVQNIFGYVTIHIQSIDKSICFIGEIVEMDDETIIINEFGTIDSQGRSFLLIALQDITRIDSGGIYEEQLLQLYQRRPNGEGKETQK